MSSIFWVKIVLVIYSYNVIKNQLDAVSRSHKRSCTQTAREVVFYAACGLGCRRCTKPCESKPQSYTRLRRFKVRYKSEPTNCADTVSQRRWAVNAPQGNCGGIVRRPDAGLQWLPAPSRLALAVWSRRRGPRIAPRSRTARNTVELAPPQGVDAGPPDSHWVYTMLISAQF